MFRIHGLERKGKSSVGGSEVDPHAISILSLACGTVFQVLTSKICSRVLLGRVPCLRVGLLSGMALQLVLTSLLLSDAEGEELQTPEGVISQGLH